jgi:uncharacterized protein YdhG (YjbR/CyaY superfamily)
MKKITTVDEYISSFPNEVSSMLSQIRKIVKKTAPKAEESISYQMPLFKFHGRLVYFSAHSKHIGFYPFKSSLVKFKKELKGFKTGPGTIQFPIGDKLPITLLKKIVAFRVKENLAKELKKK